MANEFLLRQVLDRIKNNQQAWYQGSWFINFGVPDHYDNTPDDRCGTAFCFAGHAAVMTGFPQPPKDKRNGSWIGNVFGATVSASEYAKTVLDLNPAQADALFFSGNSLEDLETIVEYIIKNPECDWEEIGGVLNPQLSWFDEDEDEGWFDEDEGCDCAHCH